MLFILKIMKKQKQFQRCTVKEVFFVAWQVFSCEFYEISTNTFFYRTPLVGASEKFNKIKRNKIVTFKIS